MRRKHFIVAASLTAIVLAGLNCVFETNFTYSPIRRANGSRDYPTVMLRRGCLSYHEYLWTPHAGGGSIPAPPAQRPTFRVHARTMPGFVWAESHWVAVWSVNVSAPLAAVAGIVLGVAVLRRSPRDRHCACGYALEGLSGDRCPECGTSLDPSDSSARTGSVS